jgi:predicted lipoprotein with Yx(FWY)xxD motif
MHRRIALLGMVSTLLLGAGIADAASTSPAAKPRLTAKASRYGRILFDGRGFVLYAFTKDPKRKTTCYGACATAWPPYIVSSRPVAGAGVKRSLIGTVRRSNGALQATYAGRPLYYYEGDREPGQILCQNVSEFGGLWLVARPSGTLVR